MTATLLTIFLFSGCSTVYKKDGKVYATAFVKDLNIGKKDVQEGGKPVANPFYLQANDPDGVAENTKEVFVNLWNALKEVALALVPRFGG